MLSIFAVDCFSEFEQFGDDFVDALSGIFGIREQDVRPDIRRPGSAAPIFSKIFSNVLIEVDKMTMSALATLCSRESTILVATANCPALTRVAGRCE